MNPSPLAVVKSVDTAGLKKWRAGKNVVRSAPGSFNTPVEEVEKPRPVRPLDATDTWDAMLTRLYANQRADRTAYQAAIQWMRFKNPNSVGYMTDEQLKDYLDMRCREAVTRVIAKKGLARPTSLDGIW